MLILLQSSGRARFVVQIEQQMRGKLFSHDAGAFKDIGMFYALRGLTCAYSFVVVGEGIAVLTAVFHHALELSAAPGHGKAVVGQGVSYGVVCGSRQLVAPCACGIGQGLGRRGGAKSACGVGVGLFAGAVACVVVGVDVGFV